MRSRGQREHGFRIFTPVPPGPLRLNPSPLRHRGAEKKGLLKDLNAGHRMNLIPPVIRVRDVDTCNADVVANLRYSDRRVESHTSILLRRHVDRLMIADDLRD